MERLAFIRGSRSLECQLGSSESYLIDGQQAIDACDFLQNFGGWTPDLLIVMGMYAGDLMQNGFDGSHDFRTYGASPCKPYWHRYCVHQRRSAIANAVEELAAEGFMHAVKNDLKDLVDYQDDAEAPCARMNGKWVRRRHGDHAPIVEEIFNGNDADTSDCIFCLAHSRGQKYSSHCSLALLPKIVDNAAEPVSFPDDCILAEPANRLTRRRKAAATSALPLEDIPVTFPSWDPGFDQYDTAVPVNNPQVIPSFKGMVDLPNDEYHTLRAVDYGFRLAADSLITQTLTPNITHRAFWLPRGCYERDPTHWANCFQSDPSHFGHCIADFPDVSEYQLVSDVLAGETPDNPIVIPTSPADPIAGITYSYHGIRCSAEDLVECLTTRMHVPTSVVELMIRILLESGDNCDYDLPPETLHAVSKMLSSAPDHLDRWGPVQDAVEMVSGST